MFTLSLIGALTAGTAATISTAAVITEAAGTALTALVPLAIWVKNHDDDDE